MNVVARLSTIVWLLLASHCHAQTWPDEYRVGPFWFHADFELTQYEPLLQTLSELQQEVPSRLGLAASQDPIHIYLFAEERTFRNYLGTYFPSAPIRPALFVKQRGPGMVFARLGANVAVDLRHEMTHAVLHNVLPMVPLWLDEGLAEYFEVAREERADAHPHLASVRRHVMWGRVPNLEKLEQTRELEQMGSSHYRDAWAWVHFLLHGPPEAQATLRHFLSDIASLTPPGELSRRLAHHIPQLERQFASHFRHWK